MLAVQIFLLVVGLALLVKGADWLVDGSAGIARKLKISPLVIGLTVVAFGTSAPELAVSVTSAIKHSTDIAVGNVVGSNIANILLILGLSALMRRLTVQKSSLFLDFPVLIGSGALLIAFGLWGDSLVWWEGLIFLVVFAGYVTLLILQAKREQKKEAAGVFSHDALGNLSSGTYEKGERGGIGAADGTVGGAADVAADGAADVAADVAADGAADVADGKKADGGKKGADEAKDCAGGGKEGKDGGQKGRLAGWISVRRGKMWFLVSLFVVGLAMVVGGSSLLVNAAKYLAARAGVSERIIALTVVAIGTSLPELVTSVFAAIKGESDIAVGNVVGSNIFNVLVVAGASSLFYPLAFTHVNLVDAAVALGAAVLLLAIVLIGKRKVGRVGGALMLIGFAAYYACLFAL